MGERAVVFDYYFTLARPELTDFHALAVELGCDATVDAVHEARREHMESRPAPPPPAFDGEPAPFRSFHHERIDFAEPLFARLGIAGGGEVYAARRSRDHGDAVLYPDVEPALGAIRDRGWRIGVLSDADTAELTASIANHALEFDAVVCSEELGCYKPHRTCFEAICARLGVVPRDAVYVGDTPVTDIEGSRRAGLTPVWINRRNLEWPAGFDRPDLTIDSLTELADLLIPLARR